MQFHTATRLGRPVAACITAAVLAALGAGCGDNNGSGSGSNMNSSGSGAVRTGRTTEMNDSGKGTGGSMGSTQFFPHGTKNDAILRMDVAGPKSVAVNKPATFNFTITNVSDILVHGVILSSNNKDGMAMTSSGQAGMALDDKTVGYPVGDLQPGESKTVALTGSATKVGMVDTCYTALFTPPALCTMVQVTNPAVELMVEAPTEADICKPVQYKYTVKNTGSGTAHNVMIKEELPEGLMTADGQKTVMADLKDIPQGESRTATADLKAARKGKFDGQAMATSEGGEAAPAQATSTTFHAPELAVAVTGPDSQYVNTDAKYTITITNKGDAPSAGTKLMVQRSRDQLASLNVENADSTGSVDLGTIAPNETKTVMATGQSVAGGNGTVVATAMSPCAGEAKGQVVTMFNTIPALLLETVDEHDPVKAGDTVVYDIKVTNQGSGPDNNVAVKAMIPEGLTYVSSDGPTQPTSEGMTLTFPTIPTLAPKASVTWKVSLKADKVGDVQFKTTATCDGTAPAEKSEPTKIVPAQ